MRIAAIWQRARGGISRWWADRRERRRPYWAIAFVESDILPSALPERRVVVAREGGDLWSAGMVCPCGCGDTIELALFDEADQRWELTVDDRGRVSLSPSVWRRSGCRSHFWLVAGRVRWCR